MLVKAAQEINWLKQKYQYNTRPMTIDNPQDSLQRFLFDGTDIRGEITPCQQPIRSFWRTNNTRHR